MQEGPRRSRFGIFFTIIFETNTSRTMNITEILPGIHYVGVNDRTTTRFEGLWSLPQGWFHTMPIWLPTRRSH